MEVSGRDGIGYVSSGVVQPEGIWSDIGWSLVRSRLEFSCNGNSDDGAAWLLTLHALQSTRRIHEVTNCFRRVQRFAIHRFAIDGRTWGFTCQTDWLTSASGDRVSRNW